MSEEQNENQQLTMPQHSTGDIKLRRGEGIILETWRDLWNFAHCVVSSGLAPKGMERKEQIVVVTQYGAEVFGWGPMQSIRCLMVVNGKVGVPGESAKAIVEASPVCEGIEEHFEGEEGDGVGVDRFPDKFTAVCRCKRRGRRKWTESRFSVQDAKTAGLWGKMTGTGKPTPWVTYPKRMLRFRALGFALNDTYPDILGGIKIAEELQDYPTPREDRLMSGDTIPPSDLDELAERFDGAATEEEDIAL